MNSVIVPSYCPVPEVAVLARRAVAQLLGNTVDPYELIVVEQGEPVLAGLTEDARAMTWLAYKHYPEPMGFARAANKGVSMASGDYLFIVNNDVLVPWAWDSQLLKEYVSCPKCGILSPTDVVVPEPVVYRDVSWWGCVLVSRAVWDELGPLDEEKLNYRFNDQDWNIRCRQAGYEVCRYGGVRVEHFESSTYRHMNVDESPERAEMVRRYGVAHFHEWVQIAFPA
jgi:GT2 family glycosyltransferase